jgi:tetratricopeptide (TPR) repeat protein
VAVALGAVTFRRNEDYRTTVAMWSDVVAQRPANSRAQVILGAAYRELHMKDQAVAHLAEALRLTPAFEIAFYHLFELLFDEGDLKEVLAYTEKFLETNNESAMAYGNRGRIRWEKGQIKDAVDDYYLALRIRPQLSFPRYNLAGIFIEHGYLDQAVTEGKVIRVKDPEWQQKANTQARKLLLKEKPTERDIRWGLFHARLACLDIGGVQPNHLDTLAIALALSGRYPEAVTTVQKGIELADAANYVGLAGQMRRRLHLYQSQRPFRYRG